MNERLRGYEVTRQEVGDALSLGHHEKRKDKYDDEYDTWNYAVRGKSVDNRKLRIIVSFDEEGMLIITVIDIGA